MRPAKHGFSLLELLIVLGIAGMVVLGCVYWLGSAVNAWHLSQERFEHQRTVDEAMCCVFRELEAIDWRPGTYHLESDGFEALQWSEGQRVPVGYRVVDGRLLKYQEGQWDVMVHNCQGMRIEFGRADGTLFGELTELRERIAYVVIHLTLRERTMKGMVDHRHVRVFELNRIVL